MLPITYLLYYYSLMYLKQRLFWRSRIVLRNYFIIGSRIKLIDELIGKATEIALPLLRASAPFLLISKMSFIRLLECSSFALKQFHFSFPMLSSNQQLKNNFFENVIFKNFSIGIFIFKSLWNLICDLLIILVWFSTKSRLLILILLIILTIR